MGLLDLKTNLKSLKFGGDRFGGGSSNQPYIKSPILDEPGQLSQADDDFLLRGGLKAPVRAAEDTARMGKFMVDLKSPKGLFFITKQNLLSRLSVATEASIGPAYGSPSLINNADQNTLWTRAAINQGIYTPLSTFLQAGGNFGGSHVNTFGIDPTSPIVGQVSKGLFPNLGIIRYEDAVRNRTGLTKRIKTSKVIDNPDYIPARRPSFGPGNPAVGEPKLTVENTERGTLPDIENRLVYLYSQHQAAQYNGEILTNVLEYNGGPGSILGIGKTRIKFGDRQRTGFNNPNYNQPWFTRGGLSNSTTPRDNTPIQTNNYLGLSKIEDDRYENLNTEVNTGFNEEGQKIRNEDPTQQPSQIYVAPNPTNRNNVLGLSKIEDDRYENLNTDENTGLTENGTKAPDNPSPKPEPKILKSFIPESVYKSPDYTDKSKTYEGESTSRVNLISPGQNGDRSNYVEGKKDNQGSLIGAVDKITAYPIYKSSPNENGDAATVRSGIGNDLVKFRIGVLSNTADKSKEYIHFRSFIDSFSDSYEGKWDGISYMGRAEQFYRYNGFNRSISMGFTIAAQSKQELIPMYKKLNFLASTLAPTYSDAGYMGGNLITLTVGGYIYEQPGFITSLTYDIPEESPWEIGINTNGKSDSRVKELPHIIKVSGFSFTPIHNFRPEKQINTYEKGNLTVDGIQRYIGLTQGSNTNYKD